MRPLCGSQTTNKMLFREQKHNTITTPQCCNQSFPTPSIITGVGYKGYGGHSVGETPGPIPNPEAKTHSADGTAPGRVWESRSPPEQLLMVEAPTTRLGPPTFKHQPTHPVPGRGGQRLEGAPRRRPSPPSQAYTAAAAGPPPKVEQGENPLKSGD